MADILEGVEEGIENYLIPEKNSSAPDEVDHDFDAFDNTFITGNGNIFSIFQCTFGFFWTFCTIKSIIIFAILKFIFKRVGHFILDGISNNPRIYDIL